MRNQVIVLDFGGRLTQPIARQVRREGVYCQVLSGDASVEEIKRAIGAPVNEHGAQGEAGAPSEIPGAVVLSDMSESVNRCHPGLPHAAVLAMGCPVLDIRRGLGAVRVIAGGRHECRDSNQEHEQDAGREQGQAPDRSPNQAPNEAADQAADQALDQGLLRDFLFRTAELTADWTMGAFVDQTVAEIRARVGDEHVIAGVSGGVDSTVCVALVHRAIGDRLHSILVDHGLMRLGEVGYVMSLLSSLGIKVHLVRAAERFLGRLAGVTDPEKKRKIIGEEFIRVFEEEAHKYGSARWFVQGTIYPDVIESGSRLRQVIKSHHNVGGLPERMDLRLLEPVRDLFKDEVRLVGKELGLSPEFTGRHPFPGPGLAVRVLGEVTPEKLEIVRRAQAVLDDEIRKAGWYDRLWQCFIVLPNVRSVGVHGERRTYGHLVAIRAVQSGDAVTANWAHLPYDLLDRVSSRIIGEVPEVNRVVLDITSKPPSTIEWE